MNHPKAAALHYSRIWRKGFRQTDFLQDYLDVLFSVTAYDRAQRILDDLKAQGISNSVIQVREKSLQNLEYARQMQEAFGLLPSDLEYDTALNTAFSEYAPSLVAGQLVFTSSRPQIGQTVSDPRTAQGYSRLFSATFDPQTKTWINPTPFTGEIAELKGNIGTFSYDSVHNIGFFTWNQVNSSGIYTVQREADGSWNNLQEFHFNYMEGNDNFLGKVAHPSVSKDGKRLLFVYRDDANQTGTDIWYVERAAPKPESATKGKRRRAASPLAQVKNSSRKKKGQVPTGPQAVIVNSDWGVPVRYDSLINTPGREVFPQWINDSMFVFASDGHAGCGGTDLYVAVLDSNRSGVRRVNTLPLPVNSSFDDNSILPDVAHGMLILSSNRHTKWGYTDNLYLLRKWGLKYKVEGVATYMEVRYPKPDSMEDIRQQPDSLPLAVADTASVHAVDSSARSLPDSLSPVPPVAPVAPSVQKTSAKIDTVRTPIKKYYVMVRNKESGFYNSVIPDSTGRYSISFLEPGTYDFTLYAEGYKDTTLIVVLENDGQVLPVQETRQVDFELRHVVKPKPAPKPKPKPKPQPKPQVKPKPKPQPKPAPVVKTEKAKELIKKFDTVKKIERKPDVRTVDNYKNRVNDPLRRAKLTVIPPNVKCEVCSDKPEWRRNVGEDFNIKSGEDKALITLTDQQGHVSYIDLAPNTAYSLHLQMLTNNNLPSLPKGITQDDIRKKVVTRDYILFECIPKLSEVNDEVYVNNVYYDFDKEELIKDGSRELDRMIIIALKNPQMIFEVEANTDERGSEEYNQKLSDRRLETVRSYVKKKGMDMRRFHGKSYGETNPLIRNAVTDKEHYLNRRTTFRLRNPKAVNVKKDDASYPAQEVAIPQQQEEVRFMVQIGAFRMPLDNPQDYYKDVIEKNPDFSITYYMDADGLYKYNVGEHYKTLEQAQAVVKRLLDQNRECYIAAFYKGRRITVNEAKAVIQHNKKH